MPPLTIGKIARAADISVEAIRYYEREGLLQTPPRSAGGYRLYSADDAARLRFIQRAKALGFSLAEIRRLLELSDRAASQADVRDLTRDKLAMIDTRIADLQRMRAALEQLEQRCHGDGTTRDCPIIAALSDPAPTPGGRPPQP